MAEVEATDGVGSRTARVDVCLGGRGRAIHHDCTLLSERSGHNGTPHCLKGGGGHESCLLEGCKEDASETSQDGEVERMGKHECEELKEGVWLGPVQALLRRKSLCSWTDWHRIDEKMGRGSRMGAEGIVRHYWSDDQTCQGCNEKDRPVPGRNEGSGISARTSKEEWTWKKRYWVVSSQRNQLEAKLFVCLVGA